MLMQSEILSSQNFQISISDWIFEIWVSFLHVIMIFICFKIMFRNLGSHGDFQVVEFSAQTDFESDLNSRYDRFS